MGLTQSDLVGYRVISLLPDGPLANSNIECFFDYIMAIDGVCPQSMDDFLAILRRSQDKKVLLAVVSIKTGLTRHVSMIPREWSGQGLLGAITKFETIADGYWHGLRILSVVPGSIGESLGMRPLTDYIIACNKPACIFRSLDDLETACFSENAANTVDLVVYDSLLCQSRTVSIKPSSDKQLGLHLAVGALNSIPLPAVSRASLLEHLSSVCGSLRILKVNPGSALADLEISSFVDMIVALDNEPIRSLQSFSRRIRESQGESVTLTVQNSRSTEKREISIRAADGILGATVRFESEPIFIKSGLRVLSVIPGSVAATCGLRPSVDYLVGSEYPFLSSSDFSEAWLAGVEKKQMSLMVYDSTTRQLRSASFDVSEGQLLGAEILLQPLP